MPAATDWLDASELRIGLGCMRLSTDPDRDDARARETIAAAHAAGVTVFDTARAYGHGPDDLGHNERLLAAALRDAGAAAGARVVTKGGMTRAGGGWVPDGRAKALLADCEASLTALGGLAIDLYLVHAPDPRTPWRTTLRALARLAGEGMVRRVGIANVSRGRLDEALALAPIAAVSVALSPFDSGTLRSGVLERCAEHGVAVIAHAPLGGPRRAGRLARDPVVRRIADAHAVSAAEVALAWLIGLPADVVAIPGARRAESVRSAARAAGLVLGDAEREELAAAFGAPRPARSARREASPGEVVLVMGIPGAGKSRVAAAYAGRGHLRLNRDERGGTLRDLAGALDAALGAGERSVVLDNTYLTRAARSHVVETAARHGVAARCVWLDTPLAQAQVNMVQRLLDRFGALPSPDELRAAAKREAGLLAPASQMRARRELEPPAADEGFAAVERVPFARDPASGAAGALVAARALERPAVATALARVPPGTAFLVFDWIPDGTPDGVAAAAARLAALAPGIVETAVCPHPGGPPVCWCRPPLPGLALAFARAHAVDLARSRVIGTGPAHRTLATSLGAAYTEV